MVRRILKILAWIAGVWAALLVIAQIILSSAILTKVVNNIAEEYVDADVSFGSARVSLLRRFPKVSLTLEDFSITYPAERYDTLEKAGVQGHLLYHGTAETADTLASFKEFSASARLLPLLKGEIHIPHIRLVRPRIFAHSYDEENANWNIFKTADTEDEADSTSSGLPVISLGHISLEEHPHIIYTDSKDTVFAMVDLAKLHFDGKLKTDRMSRARIGLHMDSMFVAGRLGRDTVAMGLDRLHIHEHKNHMDVKAGAKAFLATRAFGRMQVPIDIRTSVSFPEDTVPAISISDLTAEIATIPFKADAEIRLFEGRTGIDGQISIEECRISNILSDYLSSFIPEVKDIDTDAVISMSALMHGHYDHDTGRLPLISASLEIPESSISYKPFPQDIKLGVKASAETDEAGRVHIGIEKADVHTAGLDLNAQIGAEDLLGDDPMVRIDGKIYASLDSLQTFIPDTMHVEAGGRITAHLKGSSRMSHLNLYNFSRAELAGAVNIKDLTMEAPDDTISVSIDTAAFTIGPEMMTSRRNPGKSFRLLAFKGSVGKMQAFYKDAFTINGKGIRLSAKNSIPEGDDTTKVSRLGGTLSAEEFKLKDSEGSSINFDQTTNSFQMIPKRGQPTVPLLTFSSINKRITLVSSVNRAILTDSEIKASAALNTLERRAKRAAFRDSLAKVYPDIPKDSLFRHMMKQRTPRAIPEWMKEEDFRKSDLNIKLDESMARYFREWDLKGDIDIRTGIVMTPYFPLRNILRGFECSFNNNEVRIDSMKIVAGDSEIAAKGRLTGLRRALLRNGLMNLDVDITSDGMDANQLLKAYNSGLSFNPEDAKASMENATNSEFFKMVTSDTTAVSEEVGLIVIPSNLNADISLNAKEIKYSDLNISSLTADLIMKERCVQITNTTAVTNMGDISFDGFYSTKSKKDLKTGFSLNLVDITAEKVISLMPAVDTIMPLLKSFKGMLNCEIACTAQIDTSMNIIMPSINGVMRISGEDLSISDNDMFRTLAQKLLFKNKKEGTIDKMTVEGLIKDNVVEIFPFVLKVDRYTLAMSGIQNLDKSFKYHVSVLRSPFLIRLGIDLSGSDFDHMKFRIGKAKYKNTKVPVFSTVIDDTKINLVSSIKGIFEKGVEAAIRENEMQKAINEHKANINYVNAVDQKLEALTEEEQQQMEADEQAEAVKEQRQAEMAAEFTNVTANAAEELKKKGIL